MLFQQTWKRLRVSLGQHLKFRGYRGEARTGRRREREQGGVVDEAGVPKTEDDSWWPKTGTRRSRMHPDTEVAGAEVRGGPRRVVDGRVAKT